MGWASCGCQWCVCGGQFSRAPHSALSACCVTSQEPQLSASVSPFVTGAINLGRPVSLIPHTPLCDFGRVSRCFCVSVWSLRGHTWGALGHCGEAS